MESVELAKLLRVPLPGPYRLDQAPLAQAVVQVRFPVIAHLQSLAGVARLQDRLRSLFPFMEQRQEQQVNVQFNGGGLPAVQQMASTAWDFTSDEHPYRLAVDSGSATLTVAGEAYSGVQDLADMFREVATALDEVEDVRRCDRLGLRFLNVFPAGGGLDGVLRLFKTEFVGLLGALPASTTIAGSISQLQLSSNKVLADNTEVQAIIHTGVLPAGNVLPGLPPITLQERSFLMDFDVFSQQPRKFRADSLASAFDALHAEVDALFFFSLTDEALGAFGVNRRP